jgi:signal transduction histidine kinase
VSRLEAGTLRPRTEVLGLGARVRRAWEALGVGDVPFELSDLTDGWLAIADPDQLDQVLWALLDNAVRHGRGTPVEVVLSARPEEGRIAATIRDAGPGVPLADRERVFERYARSEGSAQVEGTGLGLYVSRLLCRAMGGDLLLEGDGLAPNGSGGAFTILLPGEAPTVEP